MKKRKLVVFDMDGTLNRIELFIIPTYREVLKKFANTSVDDDTVMRLMGHVNEEIYQGLLPGAPMERFDEFMRLTDEAEFRNMKKFHASFDGVPEMLQALTDEGYILAVCTNGTNEYVREVVKALEIAHFFTYLQGAEPGCTKSDTLKMVIEKIDPHQSVMVGDRVHDMQAAQDNGIAFIGCQYGYLPEEVESAKVKVRSAAEIVPAVRKLIGACEAEK